MYVCRRQSDRARVQLAQGVGQTSAGRARVPTLSCNASEGCSTTAQEQRRLDGFGKRGYMVATPAVVDAEVTAMMAAAAAFIVVVAVHKASWDEMILR